MIKMRRSIIIQKYIHLSLLNIFILIVWPRTGKTAAIRRRAVREAGVSRHHGGFEGPIGPSQQYGIGGL